MENPSPPRGMRAEEHDALVALLPELEGRRGPVDDSPDFELSSRLSSVVESISRGAERHWGSVGDNSSDGFQTERIDCVDGRLILRGKMWLICQDQCSCRATFVFDAARQRVVDFEIAWGSAWREERPDKDVRDGLPYKKPNRWRVIATPDGIRVQD